jgi:hypothetical protein
MSSIIQSIREATTEDFIKWTLVALIIGVTVYAGITQPEQLFR